MASIQRRWKGKIVTERQYARRLKQQEAGRNRRKKNNSEDVDTNTDNSILEGRRIVELKTLATKLICKFCKEILSLIDTEKERKSGLVSILFVRCKKCLLLNEVPTGKRQKNTTRRKDIYATNAKAVTGMLDSGMAYCQTKKFFSTLNVPMMTPQTYKSYEVKARPLIEAVTEESCKETGRTEHQLTVENIFELEKLLPYSNSDICEEDKKFTLNTLNNDGINIVIKDDISL